MIVSCECNTCLLNELCVNRNRRLTDIEGREYLYVTLTCKHKHPNKEVTKFDCDKCKNKAICRVHHEPLVSPDIFFATIRNDIKIAMSRKLPNADAFEATLCCKGYMIKESTEV